MFNTEALRRFGNGKAGDVSGACRWAADEIERLRAALTEIAEEADDVAGPNGGVRIASMARAALNIHKGGDK